MRPFWAQRNPTQSESDRIEAIFRETATQYDSTVERHERQDGTKRAQKRLHPLLAAFGNTLIVCVPRDVLGPDQRNLGRCVLDGVEIRFTYHLPFYRLVLDALTRWTVQQASEREAWCRDRGLRYYYTNPGEVFDFAYIADQVKGE